jgi:hypothetical protein
VALGEKHLKDPDLDLCPMQLSGNHLPSTIYQIPGGARSREPKGENREGGLGWLHNPVPKTGGSCVRASEFGTLVVFSVYSVFLWIDLLGLADGHAGLISGTGGGRLDG